MVEQTKEEKLAEADLLGREMAHACMEEIGPVLQCLKGNHEPDEELEQELIENHKKYMLKHGVDRTEPGAFMSWFIGGNSGDYKKAIVMHVCKHCHVFYREVKDATESVTTKQATGYTVSELADEKEESDGSTNSQ